MRSKLLLGAATFAVAACAPIISHVRVHGEPNDLSAIAGKWGGEYVSPEVGRAGSIVFTFLADKNEAYGDVAMGTPPINRNLTVMNDQHYLPGSLESQILKIKFVNVVNGDVFGVLEPYTDPTCDCTVRTTFTGHIDDPVTIRGTFATTNPHGLSARTGTWKVTKR